MTKSDSGRDGAQMRIRIPHALREVVRKSAASERRHMNSQIVALIERGLKAKGPAAIAVAPSHGSTNPGKDRKMNSPETTTTSPGTPALAAGGEAMPKGPSPEYYAAWEKCRDLGKQLSQALAETGDQEYAFVRPVGVSFAVLFGSLESDTSAETFVSSAVDRVGRLSSQLSIALDDWNGQTNTPFMAHVHPASSGKSFWFENTARHADLPPQHEAVKRLSALLGEAARIIRDYPDLMIDTININERGVHTINIVPGVPRAGRRLGDLPEGV